MTSHTTFYWIYDKHKKDPLPEFNWDIIYLYYNAEHDVFCLSNQKDHGNTVVGKYTLIGEF